MKKELQSLKENVKSSKPGSPEQITSPNIKKSTSKGLPLDDCIDPKLKATPAEKVSVKEFEELKALVNSPGYVFSQGGVTADDFWLSPSSSSTPPSGSTSGKPDLRASASQPLPSDHVKSPVSVEEPPKASTQQPKKLILGGPQRHLPQLSKRFHPFLGRRSRSYTQQEEEPKKQKPKKTPKQRVPLVLDDDDDSDLFEMEEHVIDPFRHYDPALFRWDDPNFSIGPGFFMSNKACISFAVPFLADPVRKEKVLKKLEKGTLGEPTAENYAMEEDIDEELKEFIKNNTVDVRKKTKSFVFILTVNLI